MAEVDGYFRSIGHPIPGSTNPAEFLLDVVSSDFGNAKGVAQERVNGIQHAWAESAEANTIARQVSDRVRLMEKKEGEGLNLEDLARPGKARITTALLYRSFIKSYRDVVAYGIRIVMYLGMLSRVLPMREMLEVDGNGIGANHENTHYRPCYYDGYSLVAFAPRARLYPAICQRHCMLLPGVVYARS